MQRSHLKHLRCQKLSQTLEEVCVQRPKKALAELVTPFLPV